MRQTGVWAGAGEGCPATRGVGTVVARISTDFLHEAAPGELLVIESAFTRLGGKSLTMSQRMTNAETGILHARQEVVEVLMFLTQELEETETLV